MDIDLVYLWVDGNDPQWQTKRNAFVKTANGKTEETCKGRYANNDELKYSLRSAEKHAPWIRRVFIVTDNQTPDWLNVSNPKVKIIDHKDILPQFSLPCFNSSVIEYFLYKIPDLSEHFLFANDDMFFNANVQPDFFFANDGFPIVRLKRKIFGKLHYWGKFLVGTPGRYRAVVHKSAILVEKTTGKYYPGYPHHNIDAYTKTDFCKVIEEIFEEQTKKSLDSRIRTKNDLHRSAILFYALAIGHGHLKYVGNKESMRISARTASFEERLEHFQPKLMCLNDCQRTTDEDRNRIKPFLETLFSEKSEFEK